MIFRVFLVWCMVSFSLGLTSAKADEIADDLLTILQSKKNARDKFSEQMQQSPMLDRILHSIKVLENTFGPFTSVRNVDGVYFADTEKFRAVVNANIMPDGTFSAFAIDNFRYKSKSIQQTLNFIKSEGKKSSIYITKSSDILFSENADERLSISNAQRLGILAALKDAIDENKITPDQVVTLEKRHRSFPPSRIDSFEDGMPFDPITLSNDMMRFNGATATDMLIDLVGREAIAKKLNADLILARREQLALRNYQNLRESFENATLDEKPEIAESSRRLPPSLKSGVPNDYASLNVALSAKTICSLLDDVKNMPAISGNLSAANADDWKQVASVSGFSSFVVNLSSLLTTHIDHTYCVVITLNDLKDSWTGNRTVAAYATLLEQLPGMDE